MQSIHFKPIKNWINDPNGFIYYKGEYHLFYQHFPYAPVWGRMHWGHAVSKDLVNWEHKDIAVYPSKLDDRSGCFSGSAIEHDGKMYIFYTGVNYEKENPENINVSADEKFTAAQLMLVSNDGCVFDNIKDKRTIIPTIQDSSIGSSIHTRDPKVWRGKDGWYMILGSTASEKGRFLLYKSDDLEHWEYKSICEKDNMGWMWECPDYFEVNGKGIAVFSPIGIFQNTESYDCAAICTQASFDESSLKMEISESYQLFDYGIDLYAPQSTIDEAGRRIIIAWARMPKAVDNKWSGMMCIPRVVEIEREHIYFRPHSNIRKAFSKQIDCVSGHDNYMIKASLESDESLDIGGYSIKREDDKIKINRSEVFPKCNISARAETPRIQGECELEIYVDRNLIEIYVNDGEYVLSSVVYDLKDEINGRELAIYTAE